MCREHIIDQNHKLINNNLKLLLHFESREEIPKEGILNGHKEGQSRKRPKRTQKLQNAGPRRRRESISL